MIEVRIRRADLVEYVDAKSADAYVHSKLVAAGIPIKDGIFSRSGILEGIDDPQTYTTIWRWYEEDEPKVAKVPVQ